MTNPQRTARIAGALYLLIIVLGLTSELLVRARLILPGQAEATAANILAAPGLYRLSVAADAVMLLADIALALLLYRLLAPAGAALSLAAMVLRLMQAAVIATSLLFAYGALLILQGALPDPGLALLFLDIHAHGYDLGLLFFGVNALLVGILILRAPYLPGAIGGLLLAAGGVYLAGSSLRFLAPGLVAGFQPAYALTILAEASFCLWLLIRGIDARRWPTGPATLSAAARS